MAYFTKDFIDFWKDLKENNDRDWFNENKKRFKSHVEKPFQEFIGDAIVRFQQYEPSILITPKEAVFRIYRDIRFSADKTPYKDHISAVVAPGGRKGNMMGGAYIELSNENSKVYGGIYMPDKKTLENIRYHIAANPDEFQSLLEDETFKKTYGEIQGEKNTRLPKEFDEAAERQPLIYNKSFYFFHRFKPTDILKDNFMDLIVEKYVAGKPMADFLIRGAKGA
ncbi:MAG: DUF2461 domain-containing protein [Saprospiraceae bacterium]